MVRTSSEEKVIWRATPYSWKEAQRLAAELDLPLPAATVLASRGLGDPDDAREFLECVNRVPDPYLFSDMPQAVELILEAMRRGSRVVIHGDYDADGITATALLVSGLRDLGLQADHFLPDRFKDGYGLSESAVKHISESSPGLLITVDCGVNYPDEVALAKALGMQVIVIDHHEPGPVLPDCALIHSTVGSYPHDDLCGVGLAFKVLHALSIRLDGGPSDRVPQGLHDYLDLVAVGTVADLSPLVGENRYYVKEGLKLITLGKRTGFRELAKVAGCSGAVDASAVAYRLAPRLNAAGRLASASPPLQLLLTDDESEAAKISADLQECNTQRQEVERHILRSALKQVEGMGVLPPILVLAGHDWHEGVVGIVASRLVERFHRPAVLLSIRDDGVAKGSGRSISRYDLIDGLHSCAELLTVYGGHTMAAGLTLPEENVEAFRQAMLSHAADRLDEADLVATYRADAILSGDDINADTALALSSLGPFGRGNPQPRLMLVDAAIIRPEVTRTGEHLRCVIEVDGVRTKAIGFRLGERRASLVDAGKVTLGVDLCLNEWQGVIRPEFSLRVIGGTSARDGTAMVCWPDCLEREDDCPEADKADRSEALEAVPLRLGETDRGTRSAAATRLAQVLATGESVLMLTCSAPHTLTDLADRLPLISLAGGEPLCVSRCGSHATDADSAAGDEARGGNRVAIVEWDVAVTDGIPGGDWAHAVALGPPYRPSHEELFEELARKGACTHRVYGEPERERTAGLLRYLVHPRFAMVCVYRALQGGAEGEKALAEAVDLAWRERGVLLSREDVVRAHDVLTALGLDKPVAGTEKVEAGVVPLYADAEADYEECSRLCRIL